MQRRSLLLAAGAAVAFPLIGRPTRAQANAVVGAGSSLPRSVFNKWIEMAAADIGARVTYDQIGATPAVEKLEARAIDFASIDHPKRSALLRQHSLIQFPTVLTGVMPFANLPGVAHGQLRLSGELLADIFLGKVKNWSDPKIKAANAGVGLPNLAITPVHRNESSGSAMLFTTYLTRTSEAWAAGPKAGTLIQWPANVGVGVEGMTALAERIKATPGAISFAGTTTAKSSGVASIALTNRAGEVVKADAESFAKAASTVDWSTAGFNIDLVDSDAPGAWPIMGANYVLVPENPAAEKVEGARNAFKFFDWAFKKGGAAANELGYAAVPHAAIDHIEKVWRRAKDPSGRPVWEA